MALGGGKDIEVETLNTVDGKVGDRVLLIASSSNILRIAFLVYMVPLINLIIGVFLGLELGSHLSLDTELCSLSVGVLFFAFTFLIIRRISNRMGKEGKYLPKITKIL